MLTTASMQPNLGQRVTSLTLVIVLHLVVLWALLQMVTKAPVAMRAREIFFRISVPHHERVTPASPLPPQTQRPRGAPVLGARPLPTPAIPAPDLRGLGQSVFGCAPENLPNLDAEQRRHCTGLTRPDSSVVVEPPSHVKDPQRRAAEMRTKNTPGHIPCAIVMAAPAPYGATAPAPGVDPICVMSGLLNGFGPLNGLPK